ncbi:MAG: sulfurtransferase complex subunit TusC [Pseudomonadota bacterium]
MISEPQKNRWLFVTTRSPWTTSSAASCMDMVMTAAIFDQKVTLVFCNDGVYQLLAGQNGKACGIKTLAHQIPALELYGVEHIYVEQSALEERGLQERDLIQPVTPLPYGQIQSLIAESLAVFVF